MSRRARAIVLGILLVCGLAGEAAAVVGRPLTPVSYAGVARRTARRTTYRAGAYGGAYGYGYAAPVSSTYVSSPSCTTVVVNGVSTRQCGGSSYTPAYDGTNVVYVED